MKYISRIFRIIATSMKRETAYPVAQIAWVGLGITDMLVFFAIWTAIYSGQNVFGNISYENIITYMVLARIMYQLLTWGNWKELSNIIRDGNISLELIKPVKFQLLQYIIRIGTFIMQIVIIGIPMIILGIFLGLDVPVSIAHFILFCISLFLAMTIGYFVEFIFVTMVFHTVSAWGLQCMKQALIGFFSGALLPIDMMPIWMQNVANVLPFKSMTYFPISIYIGTANYNEIVVGLISQVIWIIVLMIVSQFLYKISLRKVIIAGG